MGEWRSTLEIVVVGGEGLGEAGGLGSVGRRSVVHFIKWGNDGV